MTLKEFSDLVRRCDYNVGVELLFRPNGGIRGRVGTREWSLVTDFADLAATFIDVLIEGAQKDRACALESVEKARVRYREAQGLLNDSTLRLDTVDWRLRFLQSLCDELNAARAATALVEQEVLDAKA